MKKKDLVPKSKFLSLILRHKPDTIGISLDPQGWADVEELLAGVNQAGTYLDRELLREIVATNQKKRFAFNADETMIRANQGHTYPVELGYTPTPPPDRLYHGTATRFLEAIRQTGLQKGKRFYVHLSTDPETALLVGQRYGKPEVLTIEAARMHQDGFRFYCPTQGLWLTDAVPVRYIRFPEQLPDEAPG
jgi:putative RNA 2'-phosphotransferase